MRSSRPLSPQAPHFLAPGKPDPGTQPCCLRSGQRRDTECDTPFLPWLGRAACLGHWGKEAAFLLHSKASPRSLPSEDPLLPGPFCPAQTLLTSEQPLPPALLRPLLPSLCLALTGPSSPFSVSTVCCLRNPSSRKGEFIEEKDQSFCWKMLFPVLVPGFLFLQFHMHGQHYTRVSVQQRIDCPQTQRDSPVPCFRSQRNKEVPGTLRPLLPCLPQVLLRMQGLGQGYSILHPVWVKQGCAGQQLS